MFIFFSSNTETDNKKDPVNSQPSLSLQKSDEDEKDDAMSDDGDLACSQALDNIEDYLSLTGQPEPKIPKIDTQPLKRPVHRLTLNPLKLKLNRFSFVASKKPPNVENPAPSTSTLNSNGSEPAGPSKNIQIADKPKKNRIFCTPSDEESSQNNGTQQKLVKNLPPFKLNLLSSKISNQRPILQQQNVNTSKDSDKSENDSAYDSMLSSGSSNTFGSAAKTGKTPPIFPSSAGTPRNISEPDLSFLDTLDF